MKYLKRLLLLLSLSPIIFSFYVASLNFNKVSNFKILIWESQQQRIGLLFILGSSLGFTLSSLNIVKPKLLPKINNNSTATNWIIIYFG